MSKREDIEFVSDIHEAINRISSYLGDISFEGFLEDTKTQDAVIRNIEIIGEAAKGVSEELLRTNPNIPWKSMAGMRDRLIHHYFGVNLDIVWHVVSKELNALAPELANIIDNIQNEDNDDGD